MRYRLSERARKDILAREFGASQAEKYHAGLTKAFEFLASNPRASRERQEFSPPVRIYVYGGHVVIYVIDSEGVIIVRVLGGAQDWDRHLSH